MKDWNFDAYGRKPPHAHREAFLAVNHMDLCILKPSCAIGTRRHRDNLEPFLILEGKALMVTVDWCKFESREHVFEARTMQAGDLNDSWRPRPHQQPRREHAARHVRRLQPMPADAREAGAGEC